MANYFISEVHFAVFELSSNVVSKSSLIEFLDNEFMNFFNSEGID